MDNEVAGGGNEYDYGFRIYNPRIGKFLSVDPLAQSYPWNSSYCFAENDVIRSVDLDGLEKKIQTFYYLKDEKTTEIKKVKEPEIKIVDPNAKPSISYNLNFGGRDYSLNSATTIQGRDKQVNPVYERKVGDFTGVHTLTNDELGRLLAFGLEVFNSSSQWFDEGTLRKETVERPGNGSLLGGFYSDGNNNFGLLDFKIVAYQLLNINTDNLLEIDGTTYDANEAGNYLWAMVTQARGIDNPAALAQAYAQGNMGGDQDKAEHNAASSGQAVGLIIGIPSFSLVKPNKKAQDILDASKKYTNNGQAKKDVKTLKDQRKKDNKLRDKGITR